MLQHSTSVRRGGEGSRRRRVTSKLLMLDASGRGETGRRNGLESNLSARGEIRDVELPKVGEACQMVIPSQAPPGEGVETRRAAPNRGSAAHGEGIVQTTNALSGARGESRSW